MVKLFIIFIIFIIYLLSLYFKKTKEPLTLPIGKVTINFSTIPSRIKFLEPILKKMSLHKNINNIFINIPREYKRFNEKVVIPDFINKYHKVKIFWLDKDYGPLTKIIGPLINPDIKSEDVILITDDDKDNNENWSNKLIYNIEKNDNKIYSYSFNNFELKRKIIWGAVGIWV